MRKRRVERSEMKAGFFCWLVGEQQMEWLGGGRSSYLEGRSRSFSYCIYTTTLTVRIYPYQ